MKYMKKRNGVIVSNLWNSVYIQLDRIIIIRCDRGVINGYEWFQVNDIVRNHVG